MATIESIVEATNAIWEPPEEPRTGLEQRHIHVTDLVKLKAAKIIDKLAGLSVDGDLPLSQFYKWRGDGFADLMFPDFSHAEIQLELSIPGTDWKIVGTADRMTILDGLRLAVGEAKYHDHPNDEHVDRAYRQALLYLAMFWYQYQSGQRVFPARDSEYAKMNTLLTRLVARGILPSAPHVERPALDLVLPDGLTPGGLVLRICSRLPDGRVAKGWSNIGHSDLQGVIDFYVEKAEAVIASVNAVDTLAAESFDNQHPTELIRVFDKINDPPMKIKVMFLRIYEERKKLHEAERNIDKLNAEMAAAYAKGAIDVGNYRLVGDLVATIKPPVKLSSIIPTLRFIGSKGDSMSRSAAVP